MTNFTFNRNIPASGNDPSDDQPLMLQNNQSTFDLINVDHNGFGVNDGGYHKPIHLVTQLTVPVAPPTDMIFSKNYTTNSTVPSVDTQLFNITQGGIVSQLTGHVAAQEGWQVLGGNVIQWGIVTVPGSGSFASGTATGTVTFKGRSGTTNTIPFPTNCFIVSTTCIYGASNPGDTGTATVKQSTVSATKFDWVFQSNSSQYTGFFWYAVGN